MATATFGVTLVALEEGLATAAVVGMATAVDTAAAAAPLPRPPLPHPLLRKLLQQWQRQD